MLKQWFCKCSTCELSSAGAPAPSLARRPSPVTDPVGNHWGRSLPETGGVGRGVGLLDGSLMVNLMVTDYRNYCWLNDDQLMVNDGNWCLTDDSWLKNDQPMFCHYDVLCLILMVHLTGSCNHGLWWTEMVSTTSGDNQHWLAIAKNSPQIAVTG